MTTKRLATLFLMIVLGFSATFLLHKSAAQPFGVNLVLPPTIGDWWGNDEPILKKEIDTLGAGTEFARKRYSNYLLPGISDSKGYQAIVSMVLSGRDIANSIHRPERCMDAQGYTLLESEDVSIYLPGRGAFTVKRLHNRKLARDAEGREMRDAKGEFIFTEAYTYYWFVGERTLSASHLGRMIKDNVDRITRGISQRWCFITVTGPIPNYPDPERMGKSRKLTDETLRAFVKGLAPHIHKDGLNYD